MFSDFSSNELNHLRYVFLSSSKNLKNYHILFPFLLKKITAFNFSLIPQMTAITTMLFSFPRGKKRKMPAFILLFLLKLRTLPLTVSFFPQMRKILTCQFLFFFYEEMSNFNIYSMRKGSQVLCVRLYVNGKYGFD